jgi:hypothetical protein
MNTIPLNIENEDIVFADFTNRESLELIVIGKSGNIFLFDCQTQCKSLVSKLSFVSYKLNLQLYSLNDYVCLVQKNGTEGMVFNLSDLNYQKNLKRGDYCAHVSLFPIAFFSKGNQTFLIHGTDWNRLDITSLKTDELLTNRIVEYETNSNYLDYFHASLLIAPDSKSFISKGWVWQPYEVVTFYLIENFLREFELSNIQIEFEETSGYNWERPICWIDSKNLAVSYNKMESGEIKGDIPSEIIFVDVLENKIINRIEFNGFSLTDENEVGGELFFDSERKHFIGLNKQTGLLITDINGKEISADKSLTSHNYSAKHKLIYRIDCKNQLAEIRQIYN